MMIGPGRFAARRFDVSKPTVQSLLALILVTQLCLLQAAPPVIGVATANGSFSVDSARIPGNATLFDGAIVETGKATSRLDLNGGSRIQLGTDSRGKVFRDRLVLEKGGGQFEVGKDFEIQALSLRIGPAAPGSVATVVMRGSKTVQIAALNGAIRVANGRGVLVANLVPGSSLDFTTQEAGAAPPANMRGCLRKQGAVYLLTDETTNVTVELQGPGLDQHVGHHIEITGAMLPAATATAPATQVIRVTNINMLSKHCERKAGPPMGAVLGGVFVAAAGTVLGICLAGICEDEPSTPISPGR
jgi:hypothetical protein